MKSITCTKVAPLAGAWIETREIRYLSSTFHVAPLAGAWIETIAWSIGLSMLGVAPLAGAWIETYLMAMSPKSMASRPSRARGLKLPVYHHHFASARVAPLAGAWIET